MTDKLTAKTLGGLKVEPVSQKASYFNLLIYGDSGAGKTRFAGSASVVPELFPVLFLDIEGGTMSIQELYSDVDTIRINTFADMQKVYDELYRGDSGYQTVVIDSLTELQKLSMVGIMKALKASGKANPDDVPSQREWGINLEQTRTFVRAFRDLPMNTIFTALALEDRDEKTGKVTVKPSLNGKAKNEIPGFVDIVLYMYLKGDERKILTNSTEKVAAKDRSAKLPQIVDSATMATIYKYISGETK